ncbi:MAG: hypothetical protein NC935_04365 [Candidatus Omnitrophica bacterium]|nr:hypothetical protein [Candidatus Omnitrophota bacterium]
MKRKKIIFLFLPALIIEFFIHQNFLSANPPSNLPTRNLRGLGNAVTTLTSDLVVNIASVGRPTSGIFNPIENRFEHTGTTERAEDQIIYVSIPATVVVTNVGRSPANLISVDLEYQNLGFPSSYAFFFSVPGSRMEGCAYFEEELAPGTSKTLNGKIIAYPRTLREYKQMQSRSSRFRFRVDPQDAGYPQGRVRESNERNNYSSYTDPIVFPEVLPDLTASIKEISLPVWPRDGRRDYKVIPRLTVEIRNLGDIDQLDGCPIGIEADYPVAHIAWSPILITWVIGRINVNQPRLMTFKNVEIDSYSTKLRTTIDYEGTIKEKNESNNSSAEHQIPQTISTLTPEVDTRH